MTQYIVGCPAWDRAWSLELWFKSVRANVIPRKTGLVFVVPASDEVTRKAINDLSKGFAWLEVQRDRNEQYDRSTRAQDDHHKTLAAARNQILGVVNEAKPRRFLSWDSDLLLPPGVVREIDEAGVPISTVWTWLNRSQPRRVRHATDSGDRWVRWQEPMAATAMRWEKAPNGRIVPVHYHGYEWDKCAKGMWQANVVLGFQMMDPLVYSTTHYAPHPHGEDIPFNMSLAERDIGRWCYGKQTGVHLYRRVQAELNLGWPGIMGLAEEKPLAATDGTPRTELDEALGFYPESHPSSVAVAA